MADSQNMFATSVPATGAARFADYDACYLSNGRDKTYQVSNWDNNLEQAKANNAYQIGRVISNIQIVEERKTTNADGSERLEVDVRFDTQFKDGTKSVAAVETLVAGSTSGVCATPQTGTAMRFFGNQQKFATDLVARNRVDVYRKLADGSTPVAPASQFRMRREVSFGVTDPNKLATYAVVSWGSKSMKLLSPRILREAPEMSEVRGSGTFSDTNAFRQCRTSANNTEANAAIADCVKLGSTGDAWGSAGGYDKTDAASMAAIDTAYAQTGLTKGTEVTYAFYNDDGWKTVNGQQGKTPIAIYKRKLRNDSYPAAQIAVDMYPMIKTISPLEPSLAASFKSTGGTAIANLQAAKAPAGGLPMVLNSVTSFRQGPKIESTSGNYNIRGSKSAAFEPGATTVTMPFDGVPTGAKSTTYGEFTITYIDRNSREMVYSLQFN